MRAVFGAAAMIAISVCLPLSSVAAADGSQSPGLHRLYAEDEAVYGPVLTYLQRIDRKYPRRTLRERGDLLDPFANKYDYLLPKAITLPEPVQSDDFGQLLD